MRAVLARRDLEMDRKIWLDDSFNDWDDDLSIFGDRAGMEVKEK